MCVMGLCKPASRAAARRLPRIYLHFWRVDAVICYARSLSSEDLPPFLEGGCCDMLYKELMSFEDSPPFLEDGCCYMLELVFGGLTSIFGMLLYVRQRAFHA